MDETIELQDLVGKHTLSGVDESIQSIHQYGDRFEDCNVINFALDGKTYTAIEDPVDGYRSMLEEIKVTDYVVTNTFVGIEVLATMRTKGEYGGEDDVLEFYDSQNGKLVLSVGTDNIDDYYPSFVAEFHPENMHINEL